MNNREDLLGKKFGKFTVTHVFSDAEISQLTGTIKNRDMSIKLGRDPNDFERKLREKYGWPLVCVCDCGETMYIMSDYLISQGDKNACPKCSLK